MLPKAQHNGPGRAVTWTARFGDERTDHVATALPLLRILDVGLGTSF